MIAFKAPTLSDGVWVKQLLAHGNYRGCDYNFTNLFIWKKTYQSEIARVGDFLVIRVNGSQGYRYLYPAGIGDVPAVIRALEEDAAAQGQPLHLVAVNARQMAELEEFFPGRFQYTANRDGYDYLYDIDRLADLGGKKLHAKRNHINRFIDNNPTWVYEELTPAALEECLEMDQEWYRRSMSQPVDDQTHELRAEGIALRTAMGNFEALALEGGIIRVYGEVVAFTMGDQLSSDTFDVHFEKAYGELQGAYAIINREFARQVRAKHPDIRYLNREEDMGIEGLRKAKESYYPDLMVEKYHAVLRG